MQPSPFSVFGTGASKFCHYMEFEKPLYTSDPDVPAHLLISKLDLLLCFPISLFDNLLTFDLANPKSNQPSLIPCLHFHLDLVFPIQSIVDPPIDIFYLLFLVVPLQLVSLLYYLLLILLMQLLQHLLLFKLVKVVVWCDVSVPFDKAASDSFCLELVVIFVF